MFSEDYDREIYMREGPDGHTGPECGHRPPPPPDHHPGMFERPCMGSAGRPPEEEGFGRHHHGPGRPEMRFPENDDSLSSLFHRCMGKMRMNRNRPTTQDIILKILYDEGDLSQRILQKVLDIQPGSISEILAKLEAKEFIERTKDDEDRRRVIISLTESGREYIKDRSSQERDSFADVLTDEEKKTLRSLLKKIISAE